MLTNIRSILSWLTRRLDMHTHCMHIQTCSRRKLLSTYLTLVRCHRPNWSNLPTKALFSTIKSLTISTKRSRMLQMAVSLRRRNMLPSTRRNQRLVDVARTLALVDVRCSLPAIVWNALTYISWSKMGPKLPSAFPFSVSSFSSPFLYLSPSPPFRNRAS